MKVGTILLNEHNCYFSFTSAHLFTFHSERIQSFVDGIKSVDELILNELVSSQLHYLYTHRHVYYS